MRNHKDSNQKAWIALILGGCLAGLTLLLSLWKKKSCSSELSGKEKKLCLENKKASIFQNKKRGNQSSEYRNPFEGKKVIFVENPFEAENADGVRGHLEAVGDSDYIPNFYTRVIKRGGDTILSAFALILLSPVFLCLSIAIFLDDPGPVFFTQKRLGKNKRYFPLHKFRSMKMCTPHDTPTHMLENPEQYITRMGKFLRAHSLDELPQIWDIFVGNMSIIGPRPGLWNQDLLTAERDKYNANDIQPGLSGWAQINGRDSIEIPDKAKLDGEYVEKIGFLMDLRCFFGTIFSVLRKDGVVEGGTGQLKQAGQKPMRESTFISNTVSSNSKKILITGAGSYIGDSVREYLISSDSSYQVDILDVKNLLPTVENFQGYDVVLNVAGIAHIKETSSNKALYYKVNRDLAIEIAELALEAKVGQFILLSSMSVYGKEQGHITRQTKPNPTNSYGDSKLQADLKIEKIVSDRMKLAILRPPMVYGKGCKGNYQTLRSFALTSPIFANYKNRRSMVYIGNLCEFVKQVIDKEKEGIFFPQNKEYVNTTTMIRTIATSHNKKIVTFSFLNPIIRITPLNVFKKVFGNLTYEKIDLVEKYNFQESIIKTECSQGDNKNES